MSKSNKIECVGKTKYFYSLFNSGPLRTILSEGFGERGVPKSMLLLFNDVEILVAVHSVA